MVDLMEEADINDDLDSKYIMSRGNHTYALSNEF